jgi:hypothetical protein
MHKMRASPHKPLHTHTHTYTYTQTMAGRKARGVNAITLSINEPASVFILLLLMESQPSAKASHMSMAQPGKPLASRKCVTKFKIVEHASLTHVVWVSASGVPGLDCRSARHVMKVRTKVLSLHMACALHTSVTTTQPRIIQHASYGTKTVQ